MGIIGESLNRLHSDQLDKQSDTIHSECTPSKGSYWR